MNWQELRSRYPDRWVLVEALDATTEHGNRIIGGLILVGDFGSSWAEAWTHYKAHHHADKQREYYVLHTANEVLEVGVIDAFGHVLR